MLIKAGVDISRLRPEIRKKLPAIEEIILSSGEEFVITSTFKGTHRADSLRPANLAISIQRPKDSRYKIMLKLKEYLGPDYDVIRKGDHIRIEYDPKESQKIPLT